MSSLYTKGKFQKCDIVGKIFIQTFYFFRPPILHNENKMEKPEDCELCSSFLEPEAFHPGKLIKTGNESFKNSFKNLLKLTGFTMLITTIEETCIGLAA